MNRIVSILFVCLIQASLAVASTYNLRVEVTPDGAGTLNTSSGVYEEGASVYLRTYKNTGFVFKGWFEGDSLLSSATSFYYTMPARDAAVQARYEYDPTVPDNPAMPDTATYYLFTASVSPDGAGTLNISSGKYAQGADVYVRTYANTGFQFVGWEDENGEILSTNTSYHYSMPGKNAHLTAVYNYDPTVPANPDSMGVQRRVSVVCKPVGGGSFNVNNTIGTAGSNVRLYAYTNTGFKFLYWENEVGDTLSSEQNFYYVIPDKDSKVYGVFEYDPAVPGNPNKNYWNKELGEIIVDDFAPGGLSSAVSSAISGSSRNDVAMITVAGRMNDNDFGIANNYDNCTLLDLSRVTGITEVPSYAFDYTNLESVYLPATIEKIGYRAFADCPNLSSLTCYAMTPPVLEDYVFKNVPEGLVVYVPAAAIAQYQDAEGWKGFTILPIQEDIRGISISLPEGTNAADYAQMWLELTNTKSGQRMHYVMTDRTQYTFANIIRNTSWNVTLRNERGDIFGQIDNVEVKDEDVSVVFSTLSKPQNVLLAVKTPEGQDVTTQTQITWTDAHGNYVAHGPSFTGLPVGYRATYSVVLSQELSMQYNIPQMVEYVLKDGDNNIVCQLEAIKQLKISGKVKDAATGLPLGGVTVSASQTFGGKYSKTLNTKTDNNGVFTQTVAKVPTSVSFATADYVSQTLDFSNSEFDGLDEFTVPDVSLKSITGATISIGFTYTTVDGETQNWYSDYQNVNYSLFNITKNRAVSQYNVQYPQIVLLEEIEDGDVLRLTATSRTNAFMPVETTTTIAEQKAEATFGIVELGQIQSSFVTTGNASVVGSLYDQAGKLVKTYDYTNASLTISNLPDGQYTLVSMGSSRFFNTIYDLAQLPQTGLVEGADYVLNMVEVKGGAISQIRIDEVPVFDERKLYYTGDNTSFTVNKPSIVAGNYLTLTGRIDFKQAYAANVSNVQMVIDIPESCEFVENSVMVGNSTSSYTLNGNRITIPMTHYTDRVRFCVIPTAGGDYAPNAFAQFDINGKTVTQPIGSANYTVQDLFISAPSTVAKTTIPVSGTAIGASNVEIYDNGVLIGQTTSLANGTWATTCELNEPYNLSHHQIQAKVTTKTGLELQSETLDCTYDMNAIEAKTVTMSFYNGWLKKEIQVVFDLQNKTIDQSSYMFYTTTDITFVADLTNNDTTVVNSVTIRVYTDKNNWRNLEAHYDIKTDRWVAVSQFGSNELPTGVQVEIDANNVFMVDNRTLDSYYDFAKDDISDYNNFVEECDSLINDINAQLSSETSIDVEKIMNDYYRIFGFVTDNNDNEASEHYKYIESLSEYALLDYIDRIIAELDSDYNDLINNMDLFTLDEVTSESIYGEINFEEEGIFDIKTEHIGNVTEGELLSQGFAELKTVDGNKVYYFVDGSRVEMYDFIKDMHISYSNAEIAAMLRLVSVGRRALDVNEWRTIITNATNIVHAIEEKYHKIKELIDTRIRQNNEAIDFLRKSTNKACKEFEPLAKLYQKYGFPSIEDRLAKLNQRVGVFQKGIKNLTANSKLLNGLKVVGKSLTKGLNIVAIINDGYQAITDMNDWLSLGVDLRAKAEMCENYRSLFNKTQIQGYSILTGYISLLTLDLTSVASVLGALGTAGTSLILSVGSSVASTVGGIYIPRNSANYKQEIRAEIPNIPKCEKDKCPRCGKNPCECKDKCPKCGNKPCICHEKCPKCRKNPCICPPPLPQIDPIHDPSGYVYEAVSSNRVEGVTASCYYKETVEDMYGDLHENVVLWNAEDYAQKNPLFTDGHGMYRWDVPQGLWQVKFEKEGYETTYSDWLPVPPPQLEVNIPMKQNVQPNVKSARAFENTVEVQFDKYMIPELLTTENIMVLADENVVEGTIELLDEEVSYEGETDKYASKIRFNAKEPFSTEEVTLIVKSRVKSYAGIRMQDDYSQDFTVELEVRKIECDSVVAVIYGEQSTITIQVLPEKAAAGKTLKVKSLAPLLLSVDKNTVALDTEGKAEITISGDLPGTAALSFEVDGYDISATSVVKIDKLENLMVATPTTSIASGSEVAVGTEIYLSCATENAAIYYTLDGTCPCENTSSVIRYDGTPIVINETTTIKAIAYAEGMYESEMATFVYTVNNGSGITDKVASKFAVYPQLVKNIVNIDIPDDVSVNVCIASVHGQTVYERKNMTGHNTVDMTGLNTGMYVVAIRNGNELVSIKIIKIGN